MTLTRIPVHDIMLASLVTPYGLKLVEVLPCLINEPIMIPQQLLENLVGGQNEADGHLDRWHHDKNLECPGTDVKELQQRVAKLEALLQAFVNAFPTVMPKDARLSARAATALDTAATAEQQQPPTQMTKEFLSPGNEQQRDGIRESTTAITSTVNSTGWGPAAGCCANRANGSDSNGNRSTTTTTSTAPTMAGGESAAPTDSRGGALSRISPASSTLSLTPHADGSPFPPPPSDAGLPCAPPAIVPPVDLGLGALSVPMATTRVVMHQLVLPADVNQLGICTGGQVLSWIDLCAGLSAKTLAHGPCVTASVDAVHFLRPCRLGCVLIIAAMVSRTFKTSMEVAVVLESEDMRTGVRHHCCSAHLTFVVRPRTAVAEGMASATAAVGLPRVFPTTPDHRAVWEGAELRRQQRLERRTRVRQNPELVESERVCRLQPITHREGGPTLPPAITLHLVPATTKAMRSQSWGRDNDPASSEGGDIAGAAAAAAAAAAAGPGKTAPVLSPPPVRQRVNPGCTTSYMTQSILPQHANTLNITFGGQVMSWMEQCAYISASRLRAPAMLTAAMDSVSFVRPTRVGDILYITAQVTAIFGSSLEVMVSVFGESPYSGAGSSGAAAGKELGDGSCRPGADDCGIFHCADAFVTVVAVDERHGSPVTVRNTAVLLYG
ncbi:hypothetical protein Vretifemale_6713 [Volvox reticuliferus]|uniref:HotDog ACOT-type domain-containing protein n=1 Tax=Volvox reticuliferus TaxID=1737510 RepID=A0A8J4C7Q9_9CHLO|nr:hypothetical protein Vretifemale_6713 [Volvox reticuliferus]